MVIRRTVALIDDLDGSQAEETVRFALDDRDYEIDLSPQNAERLRLAMRRYVSAGRRRGTRRPPEPPADDSQRIREWARARGLDVSPRGRIPAYLRKAYERRAAPSRAP